MAKKNGFSIANGNLNYKLKISFYLMSIIPLLVCAYLVSNYIMPKVGLPVDILFSIGISILIAVIGFFVIKEVFDRVISITTQAKMIAAGDLEHEVKVTHPDEVGDLGSVLNQLTQRIRNNMDELKNYSEKSTEINIEIQKRVLVLSSLLQISSLISQSADLDDILKVVVEKSRLLANSDAAYLFMREENKDNYYMKVADGVNAQTLIKLSISSQDAVFAKVIKTNMLLVLDKDNSLPDNQMVKFQDEFRLKNTVAMPIFLKGKVIAILGIGNNREAFSYGKDDMGLLDILAKQIAIAIENDILMVRIGKLEIKDLLTGLYNDSFIRTRLQEEITRAITYHRPCAFIIFNIDGFQAFRQSFGSLQAESTLKKISSLIRDSISDIDRAGRTADNEFSLILPERNKRQAYDIAEEIRKKIEFSFSEETDIKKRLTISGGVSENPLDGITTEELSAKARELLTLAKSKGKGQVLAFTAN